MPREREEGQIRSQREVVSGGSQLGAGSGSLPIHRHRERLVQAVRDHPFLIVTGETGSGKTTQLPQYLYQAGLGQHGIIGVTQPRRVAAISVALRVAEEMACPPGSRVGYQVRFDDCTSEETAIKYMTDGCLLREILQDPCLSRYSVIILDEAHERSLSTDILFGLLRCQSAWAPVLREREVPLKIIVMSATLEVEKLTQFLGGCPVCHVSGRMYPVEEIFCNLIGPKDKEGSGLVKEVANITVDIHMNEPEGDILVFLTGQSEIERACDLLFQKGESINYRYDVRDRSIEGLLILPLYGSMSTDQQRKVFLPAPLHIRKCVVATNIAATSLTIDGIRYVVDCGFVKQLNHNPRVGLDILEVVPISKSEAVQRAGRAGRTSAGKCYRIYSKLFWETCMPDHMVPEIQRTSLSFVILTLKCLGVNNVVGFPYLDSPEERHILEALKNLYQNDAIDRTGCVTKLGRLMVEFPLRPSLTRALIKAAAIGCEYLLLPVAAMLSVESVFIRPGKPEKQQEAELRHRELALEAGGSNDFVTLLNVFEKCRGSDSPASWCREHWIHWRAMKTAFNVETQLREILDKLKQKKDFPSETFNGSRSELLRRCLCAGYFCNVARRSVGKTFHTMDGHGSVVHIHPSSILFDQESQLDWIIFHDVMATSKIYVRTLCPVRYEWVKDLLPKLHEVDVYQLSSMAKNEMAVSTTQPREALNKTKKQAEQTLEAAQKKLEKRNDEKSISDARARYLQRKLDKSQQNWMGQ
ncbi:probable ATP-dependent RNA helicase DHX40 isoform X2 [Chiloscyllium plagiosum]|uniref:probable ATP-dependent RNA helicase DHX40 isoform X1 n=2 Tax=Chiloscyllium plagiosum TaxID=36176 RepID=UPI001CB86E86|nr:probable ATP-dependent RNA helicase DHX40 isoform X1 [Chiloscyllium plagiosum]XP_043574074.1 probable ATP-dependent RNA helicase DHX40 isoform X2 [Chiloscyllium plagiosum]